MDRPRKIKYGALNVVANPHPAGIYSKMFKEAQQNKLESCYLRPNYIYIRDFKLKGKGVFQGSIIKYTKNERWTNPQTLEEVSVETPLNALSNVEHILFQFHENSHILTFESESKHGRLGAKLLASCIVKILKQTQPWELGTIDTLTATPIKESSILERIIALPKLERIELRINRTNPDDAGAIVDILDILDDMDIETFQEKYVAHDSIKVNERLKNHIEGTRENGWAKATGRDEASEKISIDTSEHPVEKIETLNPEEESQADFSNRHMNDFAVYLENERRRENGQI